MSRRTRGLVGAVSLAALAMAGSTVSAGAAHAAGSGAPRAGAMIRPASIPAACKQHAAISGLTRDQILARAKPWVDANVPYSQDDCHPDSQGVLYREDCSGFVSMAWGLFKSYASSDFASDTADWSTLKGWGSMQPGDAAAKNGHVALFVRWDNSDHTTAVMWEESTWHVGTVERKFSLSYLNGDNYHPIRYSGINDNASSEGTFVRVAGTTPVYQVVGGAPLAVSSWPAVGGVKAVTEITQAKLDGMLDHPKDGTFLKDATGNNGTVYQVVGGAPLPVSSWASVGGTSGSAAIDIANVVKAGQPGFTALFAKPRNGTFVKDATGGIGTVYEIVGGAPLAVSSWDAVTSPDYSPGGSRGIDIANVTKAGTSASPLLGMPANMTFVRDGTGENGTVYEIVGGAPLAVSSWASVGGATGSVPIDFMHVTQAGTSASRLLKRPADLTFVKDGAGTIGTVYEIVGGAPLPVSSWASVGGARGSVPIDILQVTQAGTATSQLLKVPADDTFVKDGTAAVGTVFQIVGGAPLPVSSWASVGGATGSVPVDFANVANAGSSSSPLRSTVADGTFVKDGAGQIATVYRVVGGAPLAVGSWDIYGGTQPTVGIDLTNITKAGQTGFTALTQYPADGTLLVSLPGSAKWQVTNGHATTYTGTASIPSTHGIDLKNITLAGTAPWTHLL